MSAGYRAISWNRQKWLYDAVLWGGVLAYLVLFAVVGAIVHPDATIETLLIRGLGTCAIVLLHVVLCIGPLCRIDARFLPLLYNRRHLGVTVFLLAVAHALFSVFQYHALGDTMPLLSVFTANTRLDSLSQFPFEWFGAGALLVLFFMAATSHDFWLANLGAPVWKALHMAVYGAWFLLVLHVGLGVLQSETHPAWAILCGLGVAGIVGLHGAAALREWRGDRAPPPASKPLEGWVEVCGVDEIPEKRARVACVGRERVAVFRYDGQVSAVSNVCRHQNGPLGEGRIVDGCITCPWHGYQYLPGNGTSPPPFTEKVETYDVRVVDGRVYVHPLAHAPGTAVPPASVSGGARG